MPFKAKSPERCALPDGANTSGNCRSGALPRAGRLFRFVLILKAGLQSTLISRSSRRCAVSKAGSAARLLPRAAKCGALSPTAKAFVTGRWQCAPLKMVLAAAAKRVTAVPAWLPCRRCRRYHAQHVAKRTPDGNVRMSAKDV